MFIYIGFPILNSLVYFVVVCSLVHSKSVKKDNFKPYYRVTDLKLLLDHSKMKVIPFKGNLIDFQGLS